MSSEDVKCDNPSLILNEWTYIPDAFIFYSGVFFFVLCHFSLILGPLKLPDLIQA